MKIKNLKNITEDADKLPLSLQKMRCFKRTERNINYFYLSCKKYNTEKYNTSPFYKIITSHIYG